MPRPARKELYAHLVYIAQRMPTLMQPDTKRGKTNSPSTDGWLKQCANDDNHDNDENDDDEVCTEQRGWIQIYIHDAREMVI